MLVLAMMFLSTSRGLFEALDGFVYWVVYPVWISLTQINCVQFKFHSMSTEEVLCFINLLIQMNMISNI